MSYEYHKEIKRTKNFILVENANGFVIFTLKKNNLGLPITEGFNSKFDALAKLSELIERVINRKR